MTLRMRSGDPKRDATLLRQAMAARVRAALLALAMALVSPHVAAADAKTDAAAPPPASPEAVRDTLSRMTDQDVRRMLIEQLERSSGASGPGKASETTNAGMAGLVSAMDDESTRMRQRAGQILRAGAEVPGAFAIVTERLGERGGDRQRAMIAAGFAAMLAAGAVLELALRRATRGVRERASRAAVGSFAERAVAVGSRLLVDLAGVAAFAIGALGLFFLAWQGHEPTRLVLLVTLVAIAGARVAALLSRIVLSPRDAACRLVGVDDALARLLHAGWTGVAAIAALTLATSTVFRALGVHPDVADFLMLAASTVVLGLMLWMLWRARDALRSWLGGPPPRRPLAQLVADLVPAGIAAYFVVVYLARMGALLSGRDVGSAAMLSVLVLVVVPLVDAAICRWIEEAAARRPVDGSTGATFLSSYESVLRRITHILATIAAAVVVARLWDVNLFALAERGMGERIASAMFGMVIVLLVAYLLWHILVTAIGRRMQTEAFDSHTPASRLRTLLPVLRLTLQITIVVVTVLSILAALGINILPLLAGASIVGVAIGFGSQTLVRDVVSGAFFMLDDAFRLGEYIEVGDAKGRVEKITVRSVFLRHHRGALNILPYGEIKRIRNTSRDWIILTMEFRLTYDTDLNKVKKILKRIGEEIKADPDYADDLIEPLKSQGVMSAEDSALIVRAKFMARPGDTPWIVRRVAYQKILKAFTDEGIRFAHREVTVHVPPGENVPPKAIAAATVVPIDGTGARG